MATQGGEESEVRVGETSPGEVTRLMQAMRAGEPGARERLIGVVYEELRRMAAVQMLREDPGHTLQPTALVHEVWLRMVGPGDALGSLANRAHFFGVATQAMRRILIESARRKLARKRGGRSRHESLQEDEVESPAPPEEVVEVNEAMELLEREDASLAELVRLRYFGGLSMDETAEVLGLSIRTAERRWAYGRAWLRRAIGEQLPLRALEVEEVAEGSDSSESRE